MRKLLLAAILIASPLVALGAARIDIVVRIPDYDLSQTNGSASGSELRGSVVSERETLLDKFSKKLKYNTVRKIAYPGLRVFIYAREQDVWIYAIIRVELTEQDGFTTEITRSTTNFQGRRMSGIPFEFTAKAPGDKFTRIEVVLTKR